LPEKGREARAHSAGRSRSQQPRRAAAGPRHFPPSKSTVSFLRCTAGSSKGSSGSSVMMAVVRSTTRSTSSSIPICYVVAESEHPGLVSVMNSVERICITDGGIAWGTSQSTIFYGKQVRRRSKCSCALPLVHSVPKPSECCPEYEANRCRYSQEDSSVPDRKRFDHVDGLIKCIQKMKSSRSEPRSLRPGSTNTGARRGSRRRGLALLCQR